MDQFDTIAQPLLEQLRAEQPHEPGNTARKVEFPPFNRDSVWPVGKYAGTPIRDLPTDYLEWATGPGQHFGPHGIAWNVALEDELALRDGRLT